MTAKPIAYQVGGKAVLCTASCMTPSVAQLVTDSLDPIMADGHDALGDVHPWTVDLFEGDDDLRCDNCRRVLVRAPQLDEEDEL
jgi:hypothetical protein